MKQLSKIQSIVLALGALLMVVGTGCVVFGLVPEVAAILFAIGAVMFVAMQAQQVYGGSSITIKRLRRTMLFGDACFILSALLMLENVFRILFLNISYFNATVEGYNAYVTYVNNNWVVALLIAAIIEMYTTHRIASELKKE